MADIVTSPEQDALYTLYYRCWDGCWSYAEDRGGIYYAGRDPGHQCHEVHSYPVMKTTAKRIYFKDRRDSNRNFFIARSAFDADGAAYHRGFRELLHLAPPELPSRPKPKTVSELKREMADAHPDRGGSNEAFIAARGRYLRAVGR